MISRERLSIVLLVGVVTSFGACQGEAQRVETVPPPTPEPAAAVDEPTGPAGSGRRALHPHGGAQTRRDERQTQQGPTPIELCAKACEKSLSEATRSARKRVDGLVLRPVTPQALEELPKIRRDPPPESLTQGHSYLTSDEYEHFLFRDVVSDLGGIYVGVGTDQNYVIAGWSRPDIIILLDFDQNVVELHGIYGVFFRNADTPEAFRRLWTKDGQADGVALIDKYAPDDKKKRWSRMYTTYRRKIEKRLDWTVERYGEVGTDTFLTNADQYRHVAHLWRENRAFAVRGDLTKDKSVADVSAYARRVGIPIRTFYVSNAEYYFPFDADNYRENIGGLYTDEHSLMLHTFPRSAKFYRYIYETIPTYQAWVTSKKVKDLRELLRRRSKQVDGNLYTISKLPDGTEVSFAPPHR